MAGRPDYESIKLGLQEIAERKPEQESSERFQTVLQSWQAELLQDLETDAPRGAGDPDADRVRELLNQVNEALGDQ